MNRRVLLLEPNYKNKFPPIGLMKISTYFKLRGDNVVFYKGDLKDFVIRQITDECVSKLINLDPSIDWKGRSYMIARYIHYRKREYLEEIKIEDSEIASLIKVWINYYKKFYFSGEYKKHPRWDWVGVTTLFTFYWDITIETIEFAKIMVKNTKNLMVGGVLASIQAEEIEKATGIRPFEGTLHTPYKDIDKDNPYVIDELPLDYSILDEIDYVYPDREAYYSYATRGCIRKCPFCAVWRMEPNFENYLPLRERIQLTRRLYGDRPNLLLMDNNVLASSKLKDIIEDIKACGFINGSKYYEPNWYDITIRNLRLHINDRAYVRKGFKLLAELNSYKPLSEMIRTKIYSLREQNGLLKLESCTRDALINTYKDFAPYFDIRYKKRTGRLRRVDFNQGVDARLFNDSIVEMLSQIPLRPIRIAFDNIKDKDKYTRAVKMSVSRGIRDFSNYLLYNFQDKPVELYQRMRINVDLCEELNVNIYSFPMKFHPINGEHSHDRDFIGKYWNRKYIRAVQVILNATKGKIGKGISFFEKAFGRNEDEFLELLIMPESFLLYRLFFEHIGYTQEWREDMSKLTEDERAELYPIIFRNDFNNIVELTSNKKYLNILRYYRDYRHELTDSHSKLYKLKEKFEKS